MEASCSLGSQRDKLGCVSSHSGGITGGPARIEFDVAAFAPAYVLHPFSEGRDTGLSFRILLREVHEYSDVPHAVALLRPHGERPANRRSAEKRDERATFHNGLANCLLQ